MFNIKDVEESYQKTASNGGQPEKKASVEKAPTKETAVGDTNEQHRKEALLKTAEDLYNGGQIFAKGFVDFMLKSGAAALKTALHDGGKIERGGSTISEPGSMMTEKGNALPTSINNPGKGKIDEKKSVKHLTEADLNSPMAQNKSEARINKAMK